MRVCSFLLALIALAPSVDAQTGAAPKDFALRLVGGSCLINEIDTFHGRFIQALGRGKHATAKFTLSSPQKDELYRRIQSAGFFNLPEQFSQPGLRISEPSGFNSLTVRSDGTTHTVRLDDTMAESPEATRYQAFIRSLWEWFGELPSVKRLPGPSYLCL
jgi:hypothetical protein